MQGLRLFFFYLIFSSLRAEAAASRPLVYESCGEKEEISEHPKRAISIDTNTTEIMLALGLSSSLVGIAGIDDHSSLLPELSKDLAHVRLLKGPYPNLESLIALRPDFVFAGWQYGFSEGSGLTPARLRKFGVATYSLNESCIRVRSRPPIGFDDIYTDIRTIGRIFRVEARAEALIADYEKRTEALRSKVQAMALKSRRIFVYDSGEASPFTAGKYGIPTAMIEALGSKNIFDDLATNWTGVSWEDIFRRQPEFIIIVDYGAKSAEQKRAFLAKKFKDSGIPAIDKGRFLVLPYAAMTPGVRTIESTEKLFEALSRAFPEHVNG